MILWPFLTLALLWSQATATFYGPYFTAGMITASGEPYHPAASRVAVHPSNYGLMGQWLLVTDLETRKSVAVKVNDGCGGCGPYHLDLPDEVWLRLGHPASRGVARVAVQRIVWMR